VERPQTRYARSGELAIAYQVHGSGDHELLFSSSSTSNIATIWDIPEAARLLDRLGKFARVICHDRRDSGLSDPIKDDLTLEAHADDALAVIDAVGAQRPMLMGGALEGARSLALLAATRPERVGGLIALSPTARGGAVSAPELVESATQSIADLNSTSPQESFAQMRRAGGCAPLVRL
jgi:pimeloyl-ACP methyl ester carboxylesterase